MVGYAGSVGGLTQYAMRRLQCQSTIRLLLSEETASLFEYNKAASNGRGYQLTGGIFEDSL